VGTYDGQIVRADAAYALARRTGKRQHLCAALSLKPSLVVNARVDDLWDVEGAARDVLEGSPGFAVLQAEAAHVCDELATLLEQEGWPSPERVAPLPASSSATARLAFFADELPLTRGRLSSAIGEVRACAEQLSARASSAANDARNAQSRMFKETQPAEPNIARNTAGRPVISGTLALVMLILVVFFQSSHLAYTSSGKALLTGLVVWAGFLASAVYFIVSVRSTINTIRENAVARSRYRTSAESYRKGHAVYEAQARRAAELESIANEAFHKTAVFINKANSAVAAAEGILRRLDWSAGEPVVMSAVTGTKIVDTADSTSTSVPQLHSLQLSIHQYVDSINPRSDSAEAEAAARALNSCLQLARHYPEEAFREAERWESYRTSQLCDLDHLPAHYTSAEDRTSTTRFVERCEVVIDWLVRAGVRAPSKAECYHGQRI